MAVVEAEDDDAPEETEAETSATTIGEDLSQLEHAYEAWHLALERLWRLSRTAPCPKPILPGSPGSSIRWCRTFRRKSACRQLERAQVREAVHLAQAQHDAALDAARTMAEQALQAVATLHDLWEDLAEVFAAQVDLFFPFRDRRGMQAFDVMDGKSYARELFCAFFPNDPRARDAFLVLVDTPLTIGMLRHALEACPRLQPFSERAIQTYLTTMTEGVSTNGHS